MRIAQMLVRATGAILLVLGLIIWTGHGAELVLVHVLLGVVFALSLWIVAVTGLRAGIGYVLPVRLIVWGALIVWYGKVQTQIMVGDRHWMVRVLHLAIGLIGIGLSEAVAARVRNRPAPQPASP